MAIDTAEKRRNVASVLTLFAPGVTPNASKDAEWRQQAGWGYSGIAAGEFVEPEGGENNLIPAWVRFRRQVLRYI